MLDNILFYWTLPSDDWLIGLEFIPLVELKDEDREFSGSIFAIGIGICRLDFLISNKQ